MIDPVIADYYSDGHEITRLFPDGRANLEYVRVRELTRRLLPPPPGEILDVGGGPGNYAVMLKLRGYHAQLIDPVPMHVKQAREAGIEAMQGEAAHLPARDRTQDGVLLFGPLYHLTSRGDRLKALTESARVLRPGGTLLATAISAHASMLLSMYQGRLAEAPIRQIAIADLRTGQHRNPHADDKRFFTIAYFHTPGGLKEEIEAAGYVNVTVYGIEGPGWPLDFHKDDAYRQSILAAARLVETDPAMMAYSQGLLAVATRPRYWRKKNAGQP